MKIYLSGEIHTDWRDQIINGTKGNENFKTLTHLDLPFLNPVLTRENNFISQTYNPIVINI